MLYYFLELLYFVCASKPARDITISVV